MKDSKEVRRLSFIKFGFLDRLSRNQNCHSCGILTYLAVILSLVNISLLSSFLAIFSSYFKIIK